MRLRGGGEGGGGGGGGDIFRTLFGHMVLWSLFREVFAKRMCCDAMHYSSGVLLLPRLFGERALLAGRPPPPPPPPPFVLISPPPCLRQGSWCKWASGPTAGGPRPASRALC